MSNVVACPRNRCGVQNHIVGSKAHRLCGDHPILPGDRSKASLSVPSSAGTDEHLEMLEQQAQRHLGHTRRQIRSGAADVGLDPEDLEEVVLELERSFSQLWNEELRTAGGHCFAPRDRNRRKLGERSLIHDECMEISTAWSRQLTEEEKKVLNRYTANAYRRINNQLRLGPAREATTKTVRENQEQIELLDSALAKADRPEEPMTLYRGIILSHEPDVAAWAEQLVGAQIDFPTFVSTSWNPAVAESFVSDDPDQAVIFEISTSAGAPVDAALDSFGSEREWLLPRDMRFEVVAAHHKVIYETNDKREQSKYTVVQLREVSGQEQAEPPGGKRCWSRWVT